jgi:hypothetical protein
MISLLKNAKFKTQNGRKKTSKPLATEGTEFTEVYGLKRYETPVWLGGIQMFRTCFP